MVALKYYIDLLCKAKFVYESVPVAYTVTSVFSALIALVLMVSKSASARETFSESVLLGGRADLTLKKVGKAFLGLNEHPGLRDIPEASWQVQSGTLNRFQRAPRQKGTGKENLFQKGFKYEAKVYSEK